MAIYNNQIKINHPFITRAHDLSDLFNGVYDMTSFRKKLKQQATLDPERYPEEDYLGDGFEFLTQLVIQLCGTDNRIGITNFEIPNGVDVGCDGLGINNYGQRCAIQIKFRSNEKSKLSANTDKLSNLIGAGTFHYKVKASENRNDIRFFIFTTADGLHHFTDNEMYDNQVKCFGWKQYKKLFDYNLHFWDLCRKIVKEIDPKRVRREILNTQI